MKYANEVMISMEYNQVILSVHGWLSNYTDNLQVFAMIILSVALTQQDLITSVSLLLALILSFISVQVLWF